MCQTGGSHTTIFQACRRSLDLFVATQFVIASNMPETTILIVPDIICIVTISFVFLTLLQSGIALALAGRGQELLARRLDWIAMGVLLTSYITICAWLVFS